MTYKRTNQPHGVELDDGTLTVTYRRMSVGQLADLRSLQDMTGVTRDTVLARYAEIADMLAGAIIAWDYVDEDDQAVPVTVESLRGQDAQFLIALARGWMEAGASVPAPLERRSTGGDPSPVELTLPQESLSENPPS